MRRAASDERCGSSGGIVAEGSFKTGHRGLLPLYFLVQMSIAINQRTSSPLERKCFGAAKVPRLEARSIRATLTRLTRPSSSSASAAVRAYSRVMASLVRPAILRQAMAVGVSADAFFPPLERGPVLLAALRRFAAICRLLAMVKPTSCSQSFRGETHRCFQAADLNSAASVWPNRRGNRRRCQAPGQGAIAKNSAFCRSAQDLTMTV
jgi:hypothetical protein